ncbi:MAG TPA: amino acid permease [Thermoanaerobaculia bacterium]|jgi:APA family basic amino acid/polyamine antiporter
MPDGGGRTEKAPELVRALGLWDSVALIMGIMIGSGIFLMAGAIARELDSLPAVVAVWAFGGLLSLAGAVALSELGAALPSAGGLYVYLTRAYGPGVGFVYGWSAMALIHAGGLATLAAAIGLYLGPILGLSAGETRALQVGVIALFAVVNCLGVVVGKWAQNSLTALKVAGLAVMTAALFASGSSQRLLAHWSRPAGGITWSALGLALVAVLWAYDGWHFVSFAAGEIRNPSRTIPASLLIGTAATCAIYLLVNVAYYAVLPAEALRGTDRVAAAAIGASAGPGAALALSLLISISILGSINGILLGSARVILAMSQDGLFFRVFGRVSPRFRTPVAATVAQAAWAAVFTLIGTFRQLFTSYVFTAWIFYGLAVAGVVVLRRREPGLERPYRCPLYPLPIAFFLLATAGIVVATFVASFRQASLGVGLILAGVPLYFVFRAFDRKAAPGPGSG